ncbi:MAG TPA: CNNM domain-containing protein, partial [Longimicrobiales bacterium]|nr:CNNM domain-containing protein [Longimicrobiales bacterium]
MSGGLGAAVVVLLLTSALLSAAETATFSLGSSSLRTLLEEGFGGAAALRRLRARSGPVQAAVHLLINTLNLAAVGIGVIVGAEAAGVRGAAVALVVSVPLVLLVAEIFPRALATRHPVRLALTAAPLLERIERAVRLVVSPIVRLEVLLSGRNGDDDVAPGAREALEVSELGQEEGVVDADEHLLVERAFRLDELTAWDVMTPRVDIFAWKDDIQLRDIIGELATVPYSRVPVYGASIDDITGVLYVREAYETFVSGRHDTSLARIAREPFFVPGSLSLAQLLRDFQARRTHMGIVAD